MCIDPVTMIGIGVSAAGSAVSAMQAKANADAQAASLERQAEIERDASAYERSRLEDSNNRQLDNMRASYLSSGIGLSGSAADVIADSATEASLDEQAILYGSNIRQNNLRDEAAAARASGKNAVVAGIVDIGTTAFSSFADARQLEKSRTGAFAREKRQTSFNVARINNPYSF